MIIFFSPLCFTVLCGIINWIFKNTPVRKGGGGSYGCKYVRNGGVVASAYVHSMEGGGQTFAIVMRT